MYCSHILHSLVPCQFNRKEGKEREERASTFSILRYTDLVLHPASLEKGDHVASLGSVDRLRRKEESELEGKGDRERVKE